MGELVLGVAGVTMSTKINDDQSVVLRDAALISLSIVCPIFCHLL